MRYKKVPVLVIGDIAEEAVVIASCVLAATEPVTEAKLLELCGNSPEMVELVRFIVQVMAERFPIAKSS